MQFFNNFVGGINEEIAASNRKGGLTSNSRPTSANSAQSKHSSRSNDSAVKAIARALQDATSGKLKTIFNYAKLTTAVLVPLVAVCVLCAMTLTLDKARLETTTSQEAYVSGGQQLSSVVDFLQKERGRTCQYLQAVDPASKIQALSQLTTRQQQVDKALANVTMWLPTKEDGQGFDTKETFQTMLLLYRMAVGKQVSLCDDVLDWYTDKTTRLNAVITGAFQKTADGVFWSAVSAYGDLLYLKDLLGVCRALGASFYSGGGLDKRNLVQFTEMYGSAKMLIQSVVNRTPGGHAIYAAIRTDHEDLFDVVEDAVQVILQNNFTKVSSSKAIVAGLAWFDNMTAYIGQLDVIGDQITSSIVAYLDNTISTAKSNILTTIIIVIVICLLCPPIMIWYSVNNQKLMGSIRSYIKLVFSKQEALNKEKRRTELILSQVLPATIVADLKMNKKIMPEHYDNVTLFFSDIFGFTTLAFKSTPLQIIDLLNAVYTCFDAILDRYDVYKVETISDSYMVVSGLPHRNGNRHSDELCTMALDILMTMDDFHIPHIANSKLLIRIGIHTGPVAAGVVGLKMPRYCLFGDTVNTTSRMETTGEPWKIQISERTRDSLDRTGDNFDVAARGSIEVKGKGTLQTFWLLGKRGFPYRVNLAKADLQPQLYEYWKQS